MRLRLLLLLTLALFITTKTNVVHLEASERILFGQKNLSAILEMSGGLNGKILLNELIAESRHEKLMLASMTELIPDQNITTAIEAVSKSSLFWSLFDDVTRNRIPEQLREHGIRVVLSPDTSFSHYESSNLEVKLQILKDIDALDVHAVGNIDSSPHSDTYRREDPYWGPPVEGDVLYLITAGKEFQEIETHFQNGHSIMASYAMEKPKTFEDFTNNISKKTIDDIGGDAELKRMYQDAGKYIRHPRVIRFGDLKEYGFTVLLTGRFAARIENRLSYPSSSLASSHVAVFAFYLFQLWDTTAEVVEVMQKTAIDIGEPGPDEDFGWGLINADHPIIWNRSIERLQQSLSFCLLEDIALEEAVTVTERGFDLFYDVNNSKREIGLTYSKGNTTLALTTGHTSSPFGLSSRFLQQQQGTLVQCGLRYSLTDNFSLVGIYGHSEQEDFNIRKGSLGIHYQSSLSEKGDLSFYAGYRTIRGTLGLPGHKVVSAKKVPFALHIPEMRTSLNWSF